MSNVYQLFPSPTDREYENELVPVLVGSLARIAARTEIGRFAEYNAVSESLLRFAARALMELDQCRKHGLYEEGKMPPYTASDIDRLAADCVLAFGGDNAEEIARKIRNRVTVNGDDK